MVGNQGTRNPLWYLPKLKSLSRPTVARLYITLKDSPFKARMERSKAYS